MAQSKVERMRFVSASRAIQLFALMALFSLPATFSQEEGFGPEVTAFLEFLRQEEEELEYQITHDEISRKDYTRAKNRISIMRQTVEEIARKTGKDIVPELHVVTTSELSQVLDGGMKSLRGVRPGTVVEERWRYVGRATKGEIYYIFERIRKDNTGSV